MLEEKDLQAIKGIVEDIVEDKVPKIVEDKVQKIVGDSEYSILAYVDDTRKILEAKINKIQKNIDELNPYYRITKLENENGSLYLELIKELQKDIEELKKKTA